MEWKKEKISAAELERRQKEYMNAAMSMVKRSHAAEPPTASAVSEPEPEPAAAPETEVHITEAETAGSTELPTEEKVPDTAEEMPAQEQFSEHDTEPAPAHEEDENYGVYTADELLKGEGGGAGLKKAAEILEEMTRSTEMMKHLMNDGEDSDTTDFPQFSCGTGEEAEDCFREENGNSEEYAENGTEEPPETDEQRDSAV